MLYFAYQQSSLGVEGEFYLLASFSPLTKPFSVGHVKVICMPHGFVSLGVTGNNEGDVRDTDMDRG